MYIRTIVSGVVGGLVASGVTWAFFRRASRDLGSEDHRELRRAAGRIEEPSEVGNTPIDPSSEPVKSQHTPGGNTRLSERGYYSERSLVSPEPREEVETEETLEEATYALWKGLGTAALGICTIALIQLLQLDPPLKPSLDAALSLLAMAIPLLTFGLVTIDASQQKLGATAPQPRLLGLTNICMLTGLYLTIAVINQIIAHFSGQATIWFLALSVVAVFVFTFFHVSVYVRIVGRLFWAGVFFGSATISDVAG